MNTPLVSIIIPHWNHRNVLADCLTSLARCDYPSLEIIVVDNNSTDDSVEYTEKYFPDVVILKNQENRGFAGGCNDGAAAANGEYLLILNNDTTQEPDWISKLVRFMEANPSVGVVQPKLLNANDPDLFDYSGAAGGFMDRYAFPFARGRIIDQVERDTGQYDGAIQTFWASGTACLLRRSVYEQVELFDETFFAHMEEIDMNWRAQLAGWDVAVVPGAVVYHHSGYTLPPESPFKKYLNHRNSVYMLFSNYQWPRMWIRGLQRLLLDGMAFFYSLVTGEFDRTLAVMKAWIWIVAHLHLIVRKRRTVAKIRNHSDAEIDYRLYQGSIALESQLFGKKTWARSRHAIGSLEKEKLEIDENN
ncbi:MAG: glycosyltransferase family 2 protein [Candidatus Marinimicrobia bacterium]|nr:glycosyltransferase family 2 protein [Candidatus Neomarinimicrobiota bacterium]MCF7828436.1 glycosyltransferase family 2 protein [Candidatus Neomarinimicrobiota bacterium]MCF7880970.1 glycosyltransferase family 2 protein [Candidatus Neomarinimicrobiota bacterium]